MFSQGALDWIKEGEEICNKNDIDISVAFNSKYPVLKQNTKKYKDLVKVCRA